MTIFRATRAVCVALLLALTTTSCNDSPSNASNPFVIRAGSEIRPLEPVIQEFAKREHTAVRMEYSGSVDIMVSLQEGIHAPYDAVWPANSIWLRMGDTQHVVKYEQSIMGSPVVL